LIRISFGPFKLNQMQESDVEEVKTNILRDQLGLPRIALRPEQATQSGAKSRAKFGAGKSTTPKRLSSSSRKVHHANHQRQKTRRPS